MPGSLETTVKLTKLHEKACYLPVEGVCMCACMCGSPKKPEETIISSEDGDNMGSYKLPSMDAENKQTNLGPLGRQRVLSVTYKNQTQPTI